MARSSQSVLNKYRIDASILLFIADAEKNVCDIFFTDPTRKALLQIQGVFNQLKKARLVFKLCKAPEASARRRATARAADANGEHPARDRGGVPPKKLAC